MKAAEPQSIDFGGRLRAARESRGLSLRVIADATRISVRALEALERNDISQLPGGIFSRAFVRSYALEVGLDPEQTIADFITRFPDISVTQGHPRTRSFADEFEASSRARRVWSALATVTIGIVAAAVVVYGAVAGWRVLSSRLASAPTEAAPTSGAESSGLVPVDSPVATDSTLAVTLDARRPTTVTITADDMTPVRATLEPGVLRSFSARRELVVAPSDPDAIAWTINGRDAAPMTGTVRVAPDTIAALLAQ